MNELQAFEKHLRENEKSPAAIEKYLRDAHAFLFFAFGRRKGSKMKGYHFHYCFLLSVKHRRIVYRKKQGLNTMYTCKRYHRLTRADNAFQRAIPVCLIQLRPPRSAPPQSPMGNPGYGSAQVNPSYAFHSPVRLSIMK